MKVCVHSLGCKVNQYEGQAIIDALRAQGVLAVPDIEYADQYVFNTCSVTAEADKKSRQLLAKAAKLNPDAPVYIIGCSSQNRPEQYRGKPNVRFIGGTAAKDTVVERILSDAPPAEEIAALPSVYEELCAVGHTRARAYIKVQDGCNNFCSYCIIPYLRGRSRSREAADILAEARTAAGTTGEIVFTGVNLSAYGRDTRGSLAELVGSLAEIRVRKRLGSLECGVIDEALLQNMRAAGFCDHFHLSLQSGSDGVLKRMNRHYTAAEFLDKIALIRKYFPHAGITTDVIAGFPGETQAEHAETLAFLERAAFSDMHVFPYSERAGTKAADLSQVDKSVRQRRAAEIAEGGKRLRKKFIASQLGRCLPVYYEECADGKAQGFTENYIKVYADALPGQVTDTRLLRPYQEGVLGESV